MIFKTFDTDTTKWTAKIGIFGKSFNELGVAINNAFETAINNIDNLDENIGFWESLKNNLAPKSEDGDSWLKNSLGEIISQENIDSYIAELDLDTAKQTLLDIFDWNDLVESGDKKWDEYFGTLKGGKEYIVDIIKSTDDLSKLTSDDLVKANQQARVSAIAHNEALKQQTLGAKAAAAGMKLLAMAGNMIAMWAVTKIITKTAEAINNYIHRVEKAREKLEETTSELESIESEIKNINSQIDELLAKEDISIIDENEIKRLQLENAELENRRKILEAIAEEESAQLNEKIEDKWKKDYQQSYHVVSDDTGDYTYSMENWLNNRIDRANELLNLQRALTEEEQQEFSDIKTFLLDEGKYISENTEGYKAVTAEQRAQKAIWEDIIADIAYIGSTYPGTVQDVTDRLVEKFGYDTGIGGHKRLNKGISDWINSLTPEEKRVMIECELEGATLIELKQYLSKSIGEIEEDVAFSISDIFALENSEGELNTLGQINEQLDNIQSAYNSLKEAMDNYSATGTITIDQFQDIISHGSKFLDYLNLEEGALNLDEEAMYKLAEARIIEMKAQIVQSIVDNVTGIKNETEAATYLASTNYELAESYHELAEAQLDAWYTNAIDNGLDIGVADEVIAKAKNDIAKINAMKIDINSIYSGSSSTSPSELLEKEIVALEKAAEAGTITYKEYLKERERLVEDYYKRGKISAEEYYTELEELAQAQVDYYDKVLAAVDRRFDREIDKIQDTIDEIEKQNELLEKQKNLYDSALTAIQDFLDAEKEKYQDQIDNIEDENDAIQDQIDKYDQLLNAVTLVINEKREAIQSEIDAIDDRIEKLQEENDEYQKQLELEKAKDALLKARNQRNKYLYAGAGKGFIYQTDRDAITEAEETLSNLTFQSTVDALEKEKELLQDVIEKLDETEQKWQEISNAFDDQKAKSSAQELFGDNYEDIILNGDPEMIASIMNQYTSAQQKLEDNESLITSINEKITKLDELSEKWNDISSAYEDGVNRQNAALLLGNEWQSLILADRQIDYDNFKNSYLAIQAQIDSNQSLIDSYNEKIEYYNGLKEQWASITTSYQENIDEQLLKQELGNDYEKELFNDRSTVINDFKEKYCTAQEAMAKAAEESARRQNEAAQKAKAAQDLLNGFTSTNTDNNNANTGMYRIVDAKNEKVVVHDGFFSEQEALEYLDDHYNRIGYKVQKYHTGLDQGYVGGSKFRPMTDEERLNILRKASVNGLKKNEVPSILEEGELVLTRDQIKGITNSLVAPDNYNSLVKNLSSIPQGIQNRESSVVQHVTVTLPNITNTGGYENFVKALNQLSNDALQFSKRS